MSNSPYPGRSQDGTDPQAGQPPAYNPYGNYSQNHGATPNYGAGLPTPDYGSDGFGYDTSANDGVGGQSIGVMTEEISGAEPVTGYPQDEPRAFVRITVAFESSRTDLVLPGRLPLTDIMPALIRRVISVTPQRATEGFTLSTIAGKALTPGKSLFEQQVEDGDVLTLESRVKQDETKYDDLVEAVADSVEETNKPWTEAHAAAMTIAAAVVFILLATLLLATSRAQAGTVVPMVLGLMTALLLGVAWALQRGGRAPHALALAISATVTACAAGATVTEAPFMEIPVVFGGLAAAVVAAIAYPLVSTLRELLLAPAIAGVSLAIVGGLNVAFGFGITRIALGAVAVLGISQLLVPLIAWRSSRLEESEALINPDATKIDAQKARDSYLTGRRVLFAARIGITIAVCVLTPYIIGAAPWSLILVSAVALILALGTRRSYAAADVVAGYVCALSVVSIGFAAAMRAMPEYWLWGVLALLVATGLLVAFGLFVTSGRAVLRRIADIGEILVVLAIIPAAVLAMRLW